MTEAENDTLGTLQSRRDLQAGEELPEGVNKDLARCVWSRAWQMCDPTHPLHPKNPYPHSSEYPWHEQGHRP
jgi:hypothetical protein